LYDNVNKAQGVQVAVLSLRVDDALKKSLESEAKKEGVSLSEYIKNSLKNGLVDTHISNTKNNLTDSKTQIENLAKISNEVIEEVARKIKKLGDDAEKYNYIKKLKKMYWILISVTILFVLISIPVLKFNIEFFDVFYSLEAPFQK